MCLDFDVLARALYSGKYLGFVGIEMSLGERALGAGQPGPSHCERGGGEE